MVFIYMNGPNQILNYFCTYNVILKVLFGMINVNPAVECTEIKKTLCSNGIIFPVDSLFYVHFYHLCKAQMRPCRCTIR